MPTEKQETASAFAEAVNVSAPEGAAAAATAKETASAVAEAVVGLAPEGAAAAATAQFRVMSFTASAAPASRAPWRRPAASAVSPSLEAIRLRSAAS